MRCQTERRFPALGQGTWYMGERRGDAAKEADALRLGIDLGMTLIDTAEMYAGGGAEQVVAQAVSGIRDQVFIVSKVLPQNASRIGRAGGLRAESEAAQDRSDRSVFAALARRSSAGRDGRRIPGFEAEGKIRYWGVSNLDTGDMTELLNVPAGSGCAANQVLYHPDSRGIEFDLLPWCTNVWIPLMAYSPLGHHVRKLLGSSALQAVARRHGATAAQVAIAWGLRTGKVISIPKAADAAHVRENAAAAEIELTQEDLAEIDEEHRPPRRKVALDLLWRQSRSHTSRNGVYGRSRVWASRLNGSQRVIKNITTKGAENRGEGNAAPRDARGVRVVKSRLLRPMLVSSDVVGGKCPATACYCSSSHCR